MYNMAVKQLVDVSREMCWHLYNALELARDVEILLREIDGSMAERFKRYILAGIEILMLEEHGWAERSQYTVEGFMSDLDRLAGSWADDCAHSGSDATGGEQK